MVWIVTFDHFFSDVGDLIKHEIVFLVHHVHNFLAVTLKRSYTRIPK